MEASFLVLVHAIEQFLYQVATALYFPVIGSCALLTLYVTLSLGILMRDAWERRRHGAPALHSYRQSLSVNLAKNTEYLDARLERLLQKSELEMAKQLDRIRFVIKVGPALGLMGTLIPMGISLAALAEGNIPKMAGSMVTAFTATVAGLGCGVIAYLIALKREKWVREDVREMEFMTEMVVRTGKLEAEN
ncbi:MAG: MotA/TolQ/ExbB proton channel family protein [Sideroxydans sp.]|nr:MotA/TolQ/ExbB proton channel family protein [Sideroxydans sp.]